MQKKKKKKIAYNIFKMCINNLQFIIKTDSAYLIWIKYIRVSDFLAIIFKNSYKQRYTIEIGCCPHYLLF